MCETAWAQAIHPEQAKVEYIDNPYKYTERARDKTAQKQADQGS